MYFIRTNIPFMRLKFLGIGISVIVIAACVYFLLTKGLNYGVDFQGGSKFIYQFSQDVPDENKVREALASAVQGEISVVRFGKVEEKSYMIRLEGSAAELDTITKTVDDAMALAFGASVRRQAVETVGPTVGKELKQKGQFAVVLALVLMLIYITYRFDVFFAPGAVLSLGHDVMVILGIFAFLGKEFNLPILAAVLSIVGYSINDTIVIYDRVRENRGLYPKMNLPQLIDMSLNETFSRTIITSLTVLMAVVILFFFGGGVIHDFALAMLCGTISGTYSTLFIACPVYLFLMKKFKKAPAETRAFLL